MPEISAAAETERVPSVPAAELEAPSADAGRSAASSFLSSPERREVQAIIEEFTGPQRTVFTEGLVRSGRYLPMVRSILAERRLPQELAYIALVESHFRVDARSPTNALGLWQMKDFTAREYGLRLDRWVDERLDPEASTRAAVRLLEDLYRKFQDWELAVAAYNGGGGRVGRALDRHGVASFWELFGIMGLRHETCRYVAKFHAAVALASDPAAYGLTLPEVEAALEYELVPVDRPVELSAIARGAGVGVSELRRLNPALLRDRTPPGSYVLKVPPGTGPQVEQALFAPDEAERAGPPARHKVEKGDTLFALARRYRISAGALAKANSLRPGRHLRVGEELVIPGAAPFAPDRSAESSDSPRALPQRPEAVHVVRRGETLWEIARRYGIAPSELLRLNGRGARALLKPGDRLVISVRTAGSAL
ncbi:MAG: transglycosylase SLT domain-containing protein [Deltaproteobacteria bacterium]|nr:transglycosylase SLT domain-containing protein [Deltaproteobacteria bacterium]